MIVQLLRTSRPQGLVLLSVAVLVFKLPALVLPLSAAPVEGSWLSIQLTYLNQWKWLSWSLALLCTLGAAFYLNRIADRHALLPRTNYLMAWCLAILLCAFPSFQFLVPGHLALFAVLRALDLILYLPRQERVRKVLFDSSLWIGVAALIDPLLFVLFPWPFVGLALFQSFKWRAYVMVLIGLFLPGLFLWAGQYVLTGQTNYLMSLIGQLSPDLAQLNSIKLGKVGGLLLTILITAGSFLKGIRVNTVRIRKSYLLLMWFLIFIALGVLLVPGSEYAFVFWSAPAWALILSNYLFFAKRLIWANTIAWLQIGIVILFQFID